MPDDPHHRHVELQSGDDLAYLIANARRAARAHLDEAFPQVQEEDDMRTQIEELVDQFISRTFAHAAPNLTINGMPIASIASFLDPLHPDRDPGGDADDDDDDEPRTEKAEAEEVVYEPFDGRKRQRLVDLAAEEEDLLRDIAALKRRVPGEAAARLAEAARAGLRDDEDALRQRVAEVEALARQEQRQQLKRRGGAGDGSGVITLDVTDATLDGREEEVEREFGAAIAGLARLKRGMSAVVARMERAKAAAEYVARGK